jgi:uncharacterized membrane protein YczE
LGKNVKRYRWIHYAFYITGVFVTSLGTILMKRANLGMAPWSASHVNLSVFLNITIGTANAIHTTFLLLALLILTMKWKSLFALVTIVNFSLTLDFIDLILLKDFVLDNDIMRWIILLIGFFGITFGNAVLIHSKIPAFILDQVGEAIRAKIKGLSFGGARTLLNIVALSLALVYAIFSQEFFGALTLLTIVIGVIIGPIIGMNLRWLSRTIKM